jgi:hypothetical protein
MEVCGKNRIQANGKRIERATDLFFSLGVYAKMRRKPRTPSPDMLKNNGHGHIYSRGKYCRLVRLLDHGSSCG